MWPRAQIVKVTFMTDMGQNAICFPDDGLEEGPVHL